MVARARARAAAATRQRAQHRLGRLRIRRGRHPCQIRCFRSRPCGAQWRVLCRRVRPPCGYRAAASGMDAPACARGVWQWRRECPLPSHPCPPYHPCQPLPTPATLTIPCQPLSPLPTPATPANPCQHLSPLPHPAPYTHTLALTVISQVGTRFLPCSPNGRVFASSILSRSFLVKRAF